MMNEDTWKFAHSYIGKLWFICGLIILLPSVAVMLFVLGKEVNTVGTVGAILVFVQMLPALVSSSSLQSGNCSSSLF